MNSVNPEIGPHNRDFKPAEISVSPYDIIGGENFLDGPYSVGPQAPVFYPEAVIKMLNSLPIDAQQDNIQNE